MKIQPSPAISRRRFLKAATLAAAGLAAAPAATLAIVASDPLLFVLDPDDRVANAPTARWALTRLQDALLAKGLGSHVVASLADAPAHGRCVVVSCSTAGEAAGILRRQNVAVPAKPEALGLVEAREGGRRLLLVCGSDARGLGYALLELADRVRFGGLPRTSLDVPHPVVEQPANQVRGIYRAFVSEIEDKPWFYDRAMWRQYLTMLAENRINRLQLAFGMGFAKPKQVRDSYFLFAYPFLLAVPGYDVRMGDLADSERDRNLETLKFISDETAARGIDFNLGLWSHGRTWPDSPHVNYPLIGLTAKNHGPYCRDALDLLLRACPAISGVTFRVHGESGVPERDHGFWETLFEAFGRCGRKVRIDMHAKNVTQRMIETAVSTGMPVTLSPKYWGEHQGLGYIQAAIREFEMAREPYVEEAAGVGLGSRSFTRYGYGDFFKENRPYEVIHRVWPGTQTLLLSGDPALAAAYGRVSGFCGGLGFEFLDPLTFKGRLGSGRPGGRCAYADPSLNPKCDWEKFLYTYRVWGRLAYNPDTDPEGWKRFLRAQFGAAAEAVEKSLSSASQVLMLVTTAHAPSASCFDYWPEIYTSIAIVDPDGRPPYKDAAEPRVFGNVSPFDPQLFTRVNEFADALLAGVILQKYTSVEVAQRLEDLAASASAGLDRASAAVLDRRDPRFRRMAADVTIQAGLARHFAAKMRSAVLWRIYERTGDFRSGSEAANAYRRARGSWVVMAKNACAIYQPDITFGDNANICGDWRDRIAAIDADLGAMEERLAAAGADRAARGNSDRTQAAVAAALAHPQRTFAACRHVPEKTFKLGAELPIELFAAPMADRINLYYRRVNQALRWQMTPMKARGDRHYGAIPANYTRTGFPLQYYFAMDTGSGAAIYPGLDDDFMNQPYYVVRLEKDAPNANIL